MSSSVVTADDDDDAGLFVTRDSTGLPVSLTLPLSLPSLTVLIVPGAQSYNEINSTQVFIIYKTVTKFLQYKKKMKIVHMSMKLRPNL